MATSNPWKHCGDGDCLTHPLIPEVCGCDCLACCKCEGWDEGRAAGRAEAVAELREMSRTLTLSAHKEFEDRHVREWLDGIVQHEQKVGEITKYRDMAEDRAEDAKAETAKLAALAQALIDAIDGDIYHRDGLTSDAANALAAALAEVKP